MSALNGIGTFDLMKRAFALLINDNRGFIVTIELLLIVTIVVIGLIAGLTALRDAVVSELSEVSQAISEFNQEIPTDDPMITVREEFPATDNCIQVHSR